jgi:hypothetical protein
MIRGFAQGLGLSNWSSPQSGRYVQADLGGTCGYTMLHAHSEAAHVHSYHPCVAVDLGQTLMGRAYEF